MLNEYHYKILLNPFLRYFINTFGNTSGVNQLKRETPIIVSLSLLEEFDYDNIELSLFSLLNQTIKPDRLILWADDKYTLTDLPYCITKYIKNGLEIKFVRSLGAYTDTIYPMQQCFGSILVTADNRVYYPKDWLKKLYYSYISSSNDIHIHVAHRVKFDSENKIILPFSEWEKHINEESSSYENYISKVGGILYPPNCFSKEVFRTDIFLRNGINDSVVWFWIMGLLSGRKFRVVKNHISSVIVMDIIKKISVNQQQKNEQTDRQIKKMLDLYGRNIISKLCQK